MRYIGFTLSVATSIAVLAVVGSLANETDRAEEPLFRIRKANTDEFGFISEIGKVMVAPRFGWAGDFAEGRAQVMIDTAMGYISRSGEVVIAAKYNCSGPFSSGLAAVRNETAWGYIDPKGVEVIPFRFDYAGTFENGLAPVRIGGRWGCIDRTGNTVVPIRYDSVSVVEGKDAVRVERYGKHGFVAKDGEELFVPQWDTVTSAADGWFAGRQGKAWFIGDLNTRTITQVAISGLMEVHTPSEGFAGFTVRQRGAVVNGFLGRHGQVAVAPRFSRVRGFSEGKAAVRRDSKSGYIDPTGRYVIALDFDLAGYFHGGYAVVLTKTGWGVIDKMGSFVLDPVFELCYPPDRGLVLTCTVGRRGNIGETGVAYDVTWAYVTVDGKTVWSTEGKSPYYGTIEYWYEPPDSPAVHQMKMLGQRFR